MLASFSLVCVCMIDLVARTHEHHLPINTDGLIDREAC